MREKDQYKYRTLPKGNSSLREETLERVKEIWDRTVKEIWDSLTAIKHKNELF